jgi:hypothetical protein
MFVETVRIESLSNNSYVIGSEQSGRCVVLDPVRDNVQVMDDQGTPAWIARGYPVETGDQ